VIATARSARALGLAPEAPEAVVAGFRRGLVGQNLGPKRPPDEVEEQPDGDLQDHHQEEDG
jgi:hypothetical protein